jgi:hypothetical protein
MSALDESARRKLGKIVALFASDKAGEVAAAAAAGSRLLAEHGLGWSDVLTSPTKVETRLVTVPVECEHCHPSPYFSWRRLADEILDIDAERDLLSDWEWNFTSDLRRRAYPPTSRQREILMRIAKSVGVR